MGRVSTFGSIKLLRLALGFFFIVLGFLGVLTNIEEGMFTLNNNNITLEVIFGVIEIICGLLLVFGLFAFRTQKAVYFGGLVVFFFWLTRILLTKFLWCFNFSNNSFSFVFRPNMYNWFLTISCELVILAAISLVVNRYE